MKKVFACMLSLSALAATAQDKGVSFTSKSQEPAAIITGQLDQAPNDTIICLVEPYSGDTASAIIKDHKFQMRMPLAKGGSVYIMQIGNDAEKGGTLIYLEDGKIDIKGKGAGFSDAKFTGKPYVKEWQEVMDLTDPKTGDNKIMAELQKKYDEAKAIGDEDAIEALKKEGNVVDKRIKDRLRNWITEHPNSGVSGYILTVYFSANKKYFDSVYNTLGDHAKSSRILQRYINPGKIDKQPTSVKTNLGVQGDLPGKVAKGKPAPDFSIPDFDGNTVTLSGFKGKYIFIDFWASWCAPCIAQVPHMKEVYAKFSGNPKFQMLGVSLDTKREGWEKAIKKYALPWLNVSNLKGWAEPVAALYGVAGIPSSVLIDPDGNVVANDLSGEALIKKLEELLK